MLIGTGRTDNEHFDNGISLRNSTEHAHRSRCHTGKLEIIAWAKLNRWGFSRLLRKR
jgi:hypothetical protein